MFSSYNKNNAKGTLVGNWVEEEALRAATGFSRRKVPAPRSPEKTPPEPTHNRVLLHANDNGRTTYETTLQASTNYGEGVVRVAPGPRSSLRDVQALEMARQLHEREAAAKRAAQEQELHAVSSSSTFKTTFPAPDTATLLASTRVPRGRNGSRVIDTSVAHLTRAQVDSLDQAKLEQLRISSPNQSPLDAPAITRYSYAVATGVGLDFGTTASDGANPFARSSTFSNDIRDPFKRHAEAMEPASTHDEPVGMTVHQRSALKRLMAAWSQPRLLQALSQAAGNNGSVIDLAAFRAMLASFQFSDRDAIHAFMYFDLDHIGAVPLAAITSFCDAQQATPTL